MLSGLVREDLEQAFNPFVMHTFPATFPTFPTLPIGVVMIPTRIARVDGDDLGLAS